ncbi:SlyX family protein [Zwartia sp.]|uniref:SlyX family protein n=1 Tax=Zwartia sp. TaxID=2978004 RepID=UPI00271EF5E0|nr:SlyX family protein [Zwartia sp.]MDO9024034.1 SlyX family protein [Zwartia sp.]
MNAEQDNKSTLEQRVEQRLTDLEIKAGLADDMLDQLNQTIFRQQQMIDALAREVNALRQQLPQDRNSGLQNLRDELPPHY